MNLGARTRALASRLACTCSACLDRSLHCAIGTQQQLRHCQVSYGYWHDSEGFGAAAIPVREIEEPVERPASAGFDPHQQSPMPIHCNAAKRCGALRTGRLLSFNQGRQTWVVAGAYRTFSTRVAIISLQSCPFDRAVIRVLSSARGDLSSWCRQP